MASVRIEELLELPVKERKEIAERLWESVEREDGPYPAIPPWQRELLEERLQDLDRNPGDEQSWAEVKGRALA